MVPKKILAIKTRALGDTVLLTASLDELHKAYPDATIHAVVLKQWASVLENNPSVHKIWTYDRHSEKTSRAKALARLALSLWKEHYDCVVNFHASPSSATLAFASGARTRSIHFHGHGDKNRYSTVTIPGKGVLKPIIERDMDAVRALGLHIPAGRKPSLPLQVLELNEAETFLKKLQLQGPVIGLGLGSSRPTKAWPVERFAALAVKWCLKNGGSALAITGPGELDLANRFLKSVDDSLNELIPNGEERIQVRARITSVNNMLLRPLAAILSKLSLLVGNDSGPKHMAVAVETPTVTLFGPEHPFEWHPYPSDRHPFLFVEELSCRRDASPGMPPWCALDVCVQEQHRCMRMIGIDAVMTECERVARRS